MNLENCDLIKIMLSVESDSIEDSFEFSHTATVNTDDYNSALEAIGCHMSMLLKSMGYKRPHDYIFMRSVTEEECTVLTKCLQYYRDRKECKDKEA